MATAIREKIIEQVDRLSDKQQEQVLRYATTIGQRPIGVPGKDLLSLKGTISKEDADTMMRVIEEDCGRIDPNEW